MANWTDISDAVLEPGKPIRSVDGIALRDNPIAMAEGAAGAPRIEQAALASNSVSTAKIVNSNVTAAKLADGSAESNWVGARTAALSVGANGTYAMLKAVSGGAGGPGATRSGGDLRYTDNNSTENGGPSGTWMLCGAQTGVPAVWKRVA